MKEAYKVNLDGFIVDVELVHDSASGISPIYEKPEPTDENEQPEEVLVGYRVYEKCPDGFFKPRFDVQAYLNALTQYERDYADYLNALNQYDPESDNEPPIPPAPVNGRDFWVEGMNQEEIDKINPPVTLQDIKNKKIEELNRACNETILAGFVSSALGEENLYDFDYEAQINLNGQLNFINAGLTPPDAIIMWKANGVPKEHTVEQFKVVCEDGFAHKQSNISKYWMLKQQVEQAEDEETINAITW